MHEHRPNKGCPFDFNESITCRTCIQILWDKRFELCQKHGWSEWPRDLNQGRDYLPHPLELEL